jgi:AraC-like DNA-binding protein
MRVYKSSEYIESGHRIGVFSSGDHTAVEKHAHEFIELVYVREGSARHYIDENCFEVARGDILFINYGSVHAFEPCDRFSYVNICFYPEVVSDSILTRENATALLSLIAFNEMRGEKNSGCIRFYGSERADVEWILEKMLAEHAEGRPFSDKVIEDYMRILITMMLRKNAPLAETAAVGGPWEELRIYIDENLSSELTLSALAKKSFYNPSYFSRSFHRRFGVSLTEYVSRRRIALAVSLLEEGELSIDAIMERCGFSDRSGFYHAFSKYMGKTPAKLRRARDEKK